MACGPAAGQSRSAAAMTPMDEPRRPASEVGAWAARSMSPSRCGDRRSGVARRLRGDDYRAFPHGRARRVCIIAVRLPPVAVYSSLTPAVFGLDPGGSGPFSLCARVRVVYRHRLGGPRLSAGRAAGRSFVYRRWPAAAGQVRPSSVAASPAELFSRKIDPPERPTSRFLAIAGARPTQQSENASWAAYRSEKALLNHSAHRPGFSLPSLKTGFQALAIHQRLCSRAHTRPVERWPRRRRGQRDLSGS